MEQANPEEYVKLFVGNLPRDMNEEDLTPTFNEYGSIIEIHVIRGQFGQSKGTTVLRLTPNETTKGSAFVKYGKIEEATACISALNDTAVFEHSSKPLEVRLATGEEARLERRDQGGRLFIGKIPATCTEDDLRKLFTAYGEVEELVLKKKPDGSHKNFGFIKFASRTSAEAAIRELSGATVTLGSSEAALRVEFAEPPKASPQSASYPSPTTHTFTPTSTVVPIIPQGTRGFQRLPPHLMAYSAYPMYPPHPQPFMMASTGFRPTTLDTQLYVGGLPSNVSRQQLTEMFAFYGVVLEVHIMRPKMGAPFASAFIRYATQEECELAIININGYPFPGTTYPLVVKYANATAVLPEHAPPGAITTNKLFVGGIPLNCTEDDVTNVFELFGTVKDIHLMRHADGTSKGSAFVRYVTPEMAENALLRVNGSVTMKGGHRPLTVTFAPTHSHFPTIPPPYVYPHAVPSPSGFTHLSHHMMYHPTPTHPQFHPMFPAMSPLHVPPPYPHVFVGASPAPTDSPLYLMSPPPFGRFEGTRDCRKR